MTAGLLLFILGSFSGFLLLFIPRGKGEGEEGGEGEGS
jgi:hypothetical protein